MEGSDVQKEKKNGNVRCNNPAFDFVAFADNRLLEQQGSG